MIYDDFADRLKRDYELFLFALSGRYLSLIAPGLEVSPMVVAQMQGHGNQLRETFVDTVAQTVRQYESDQLSARGESLSKDFLAVVEDISRQNVASLTERLKASGTGMLTAMDDMHGAMGLLLQQKLAQPEFAVKTRSGRTFQAVPLMRSQARDYAYRTYLASELSTYAIYTDLASVVYADPTHEDHGRVFSITGRTPGFPSFADLEESVFHFNSTAHVTDHVPA